MAAGTVVVRSAPTRRRAAALVPGATRATEAVPSVTPLPAGAATWDLTGVGDEDLRVVRSFLARRPELDPAARARVGAELARRLRPVVVGTGPHLPDEELLEQVLAAKTSRP
jgi:hypothetical protein